METGPKKLFAVESAPHWKALSHPLRLGVLRLLTQDSLTNEELARALGVQSGKLHFHTRVLLTAGLIETAGTRQKGPITEKLYRASAQRFVASPSDADGDPPLVDAVTAGLALYQTSWRQDPSLMQIGYHLVLDISPRRAHEFGERLRQLAEEFAQSPSAEADARTVALTMLMHTVPAHSFPGDQSS